MAYLDRHGQRIIIEFNKGGFVKATRYATTGVSHLSSRQDRAANNCRYITWEKEVEITQIPQNKQTILKRLCLHI
jgi:hypothetical protein